MTDQQEQIGRKIQHVRLEDHERAESEEIVSSGRGSAERRRRAHILLLTDENRKSGARADADAADSVGVGTATVERLRRRFVEEGTAALERRPHSNRVPPKLDGEGEAKLTMIACSEPPEGRSSQPPALLGERLVALNVVDGISRETVRRTLKKTI